MIIDLDADHRIKPLIPLIQPLVQSLGLDQGSGEAIQQVPVPDFRSPDVIHHHRENHVVRDQGAAIHVVLRLSSQLGQCFPLGAQDVAAG
jgi:hypothetical protein